MGPNGLVCYHNTQDRKPALRKGGFRVWGFRVWNPKPYTLNPKPQPYGVWGLWYSGFIGSVVRVALCGALKSEIETPNCEQQTQPKPL